MAAPIRVKLTLRYFYCTLLLSTGTKFSTHCIQYSLLKPVLKILSLAGAGHHPA